ncbi:MAG: aminotransferase class I/II-fold pyridoxal phosphate-dependent enzyme [Acidimicrobiales bacterium]|nr:MAG: aminotransferase class I/II-fold pyridoxal phosphate-dependent enzyme [Acidimicrobiales bacterium]
MNGRLVLPEFKLETYFSTWEFTARHHLTASDAESMTVAELLALGTDEDLQAYENLHLGYTPTWGTEPLRAAIAGSYESLTSSNVLGFAGAGEALFWAMQLFVEPGEHVIVNVPNYQSIESIPLATGVAVSGLPLWSGTGADLRWELDLERFESLLRAETSLVSVNFPNNPTGFVPDHETWSAFNALCHERGIRVVSDEVYRGVETNPDDTIAAAADINPSALSISVTSKAYGLPGLRVGWVASQDVGALGRLEKAKHYTSICNSAPSELLATVALNHGDVILDRNRAIVAANDQIVTEFAQRHPDLFEYETPVGGCVTFPRYLGPEGPAEFCRRAVEESGVFLLPYTVYESELGAIPEDRFRIGIGRRDVPQSVAALERHLETIV